MLRHNLTIKEYYESFKHELSDFDLVKDDAQNNKEVEKVDFSLDEIKEMCSVEDLIVYELEEDDDIKSMTQDLMETAEPIPVPSNTIRKIQLKKSLQVAKMGPPQDKRGAPSKRTPSNQVHGKKASIVQTHTPENAQRRSVRQAVKKKIYTFYMNNNPL